MQNRDGGFNHHGSSAAPGATVEAKEDDTEAPTELGANYRYWREHGHEWADEYAQRKKLAPYYHLQELMLTDYVARCAPAKVLEFGCGVGRHLRNLAQIPGIDVRGYDQSRAMVSGCLRWTSQEWIDSHISIGLPTGPLPFADGEFDVVYSAEVLLHSRPEDIETILRELVRVCRGHILHLETSPGYALIQQEHDGCWKHDLVASYARLGHKLEMLDAGYLAHTPFRLTLGSPGPEPAWPAQVLAIMRRAESDLCEGIADLRTHALDAVRQAEHAEAAAAAAAEKLLERIHDLEADRDRLFAEAREKQDWIASLESDRDRLFAEAKDKQAWINSIESELVEVKMRLSSALASAEARGAAAARREAMLNTQITALTGRLRDQTDRLVAAESVLKAFAEAVRTKLKPA